jgi:hypothetical protein
MTMDVSIQAAPQVAADATALTNSPVTRRGVPQRRLCDTCAQRKAEVKVTLDDVTRRLCTTCAAREQKERESLDAMAAGPKCEEVIVQAFFFFAHCCSI